MFFYIFVSVELNRNIEKHLLLSFYCILLNVRAKRGGGGGRVRLRVKVRVRLGSGLGIG